MTRVGLVSDTSRGESDNPVENSDLIIAFASLTQSASDLELKILCQFGLVVIEIGIQSHGSEVIAMHDDRNVAVWVMKTTWARGARHW